MRKCHFLDLATSMAEKGPAKVKGYSAQRLPTRTSDAWTDLGSNITVSRTGKCATSWEMWVARRSQRPTVGRCTMGTAFLRRQNWLGWNHRGSIVADQCTVSASAYEAAVGDGSKHTSRVHGHDYEARGWSRAR
jgi:hypothetical protein